MSFKDANCARCFVWCFSRVAPNTPTVSLVLLDVCAEPLLTVRKVGVGIHIGETTIVM